MILMGLWDILDCISLIGNCTKCVSTVQLIKILLSEKSENTLIFFSRLSLKKKKKKKSLLSCKKMLTYRTFSTKIYFVSNFPASSIAQAHDLDFYLSLAQQL